MSIKELHLFIFSHALKQKSPPGFYHHYSRQREITHFPQTKFFENLFFPSREGEDYGAENMTKIKLARTWSQVLLYSTICKLSLKSIVCKNNYMKDKTLPYFLTISPTICNIKIFILTFFSYFKKFLPYPLQYK